jgi:HSP20 family protein
VTILHTVKHPVRPSPFDDFDRFIERFSRHLSELGWPEMEEADAPRRPALDVTVYDDQVLVAADLAGYAEEGVHVAVGDGTLLVRAERRSAPFQSSLTREVALPAGLDPEAARATFNNGVLTVTFPSAEGDTDTTVVDVQ